MDKIMRASFEIMPSETTTRTPLTDANKQLLVEELQQEMKASRATTNVGALEAAMKAILDKRKTLDHKRGNKFRYSMSTLEVKSNYWSVKESERTRRWSSTSRSSFIRQKHRESWSSSIMMQLDEEKHSRPIDGAAESKTNHEDKQLVGDRFYETLEAVFLLADQPCVKYPFKDFTTEPDNFLSKMGRFSGSITSINKVSKCENPMETCIYQSTRNACHSDCKMLFATEKMSTFVPGQVHINTQSNNGKNLLVSFPPERKNKQSHARTA